LSAPTILPRLREAFPTMISRTGLMPYHCSARAHDPLIRSPEVATFDHGVHLPQPFRFRLPIRRRTHLSTQPSHQRKPFASFRSGSSPLLCAVTAQSDGSCYTLWCVNLIA
jgi:hypothetical protein